MRSRLRAQLIHEEGGFSLVELLAAMVIALIVFAAVLQFATVGQKRAALDRQRGLALMQADLGLYRMTKELRQGTPPTAAQNCTDPCSATAPDSTNSVDVIIGSSSGSTCNSNSCLRVKYDCSTTSPLNSSYRECCRYASTTLTAAPTYTSAPTTSAPCGLGGKLVIDRVTGPTYIFQPATGATLPSYYNVVIDVPKKGEYVQGVTGTYGNYEFSDGVYLRNAAGDL